MKSTQIKELLLQSLEHERGGVLVYRTALECVRDERLSDEWKQYLAQTENHVRVLTRVCVSLGLDPNERTPGCEVVHHTGTALVVAMKKALAAGDPAAAELVACDCVVLAETKDHANWELIGECAKAADGDAARLLSDAYAEVEDEEDEHLYHSKGWSRELWLQALGLKALLPPPEEEKDVKTATEAARAKESARAVR
jgi:rubrerythrin